MCKPSFTSGASAFSGSTSWVVSKLVDLASGDGPERTFLGFNLHRPGYTKGLLVGTGNGKYPLREPCHTSVFYRSENGVRELRLVVLDTT